MVKIFLTHPCALPLIFWKNVFFGVFANSAKNTFQFIARPFDRIQINLLYNLLYKEDPVFMNCQYFLWTISWTSYEIKSAEHILNNSLLWIFDIRKNLNISQISYARSIQKKIKTGPKFKNRIIVKLFFIFLSFFLSTFFSFRNIKIWLQILKDRTRYTLCKYKQIRAISSNGGPGGRLAPPASKCHKKKVWICGSQTLTQFV